MKVNIEKNLYIESDEMQYVLREYSGKFDKTGKEIYKTHGYFSTIQSALQHLLQMRIKESTAQTLSELHRDVENIRQYIESKIQY